MGLAGISPLFIVGEDIGVMLDKSFVAICDFWAVFKSRNAVGVEILSSSASTYRKSIALPEEALSRRASGEGYAKQALC